jgi:1-acyl-sn-glycerol-3-phosphate acyltransferase
MSSFRSGIGILAKQLKIPVVPMRIDGLFPLKLAKRHFANPGDIKVMVGNAMQFQDEMPPEAITHALEDAVRNLHTQQ